MTLLYSIIIKRVIEQQLGTELHPPNYCDQDPKPPCETFFGVSTEICPELHNWKKIYQSTLPLSHFETISFIFLFNYSNRLYKVGLGNNITVSEKPSVVYSRNSRQKFELIKQVYANHFFEKQSRHSILSTIQKAQRAYYGFTRLARIYRLRRTPVQINSDLYMSELDPLKRTTFILLTRDKQYYFSLNDLAKIMVDSLTYSYMLFSEPKVCKNPYTNVPFSKSTLYNIYFQMKSVFCVVPRIIQLYFESGFDVFALKKQNEPYLRELIIREYVAKTEPTRLRSDILKMVRGYDSERKLQIHPSFPAEALVKGLKSMYTTYLLHKHTTDDQMYDYYSHELTYSMNEFIRTNPNFGKMVTVPNPNNMLIRNTNTSSNQPPTSDSTSRIEDNSEVFSSIVFRQAIIQLSQITQSTNPFDHPANHMFKNPIVKYHEWILPSKTDTVLDFLDSHQFSEPAYNRYIHTGTPIVLDTDDEPVPSLPLPLTHSVPLPLPSPSEEMVAETLATLDTRIIAERSTVDVENTADSHPAYFGDDDNDDDESTIISQPTDFVIEGEYYSEEEDENDSIS